MTVNILGGDQQEPEGGQQQQRLGTFWPRRASKTRGGQQLAKHGKNHRQHFLPNMKIVTFNILIKIDNDRRSTDDGGAGVSESSHRSRGLEHRP